METRCIDAEHIAAILELPPDAPERVHVDTCPRCRGVVDSYRAFLAAEPMRDSGLEDARRALNAHIQAEATRWLPDSRPVSAPWWRMVLRPAPLLATAVVAVVGVWWFTQTPEPSIPRGSAPAQAEFVLHAPEVRPDGAIALSWSAVERADRYEVRIYGPDLREAYRSDATATTLVVPRSALANVAPGDLTWEVHAHVGSDLISVSPPGSIHLP